MVWNSKSIRALSPQAARELFVEMIGSDTSLNVNDYLSYIITLKSLMEKAIATHNTAHVAEWFDILVMLYEFLSKTHKQSINTFEIDKIVVSLRLILRLRQENLEALVDEKSLLEVLQRKFSAYSMDEVAKMIDNLSWDNPDIDLLIYLRNLRHWVYVLDFFLRTVRIKVETELTHWLQFRGKLP